MTTQDFQRYAAVILGDPACGDESAISAAEDNPSVWGAAVNGPIAVIGTDPTFHYLYGFNNRGAYDLMRDALSFVLSSRGSTGAYVALSCYFAYSREGTPLSFLSQAFGGTWTVQGGIPCDDSGRVVSSTASRYPSNLGNLTDEDLYLWRCSIHETIEQWPASFDPLTLAPGVSPTTYTLPDGTEGEPYIVVGSRFSGGRHVIMVVHGLGGDASAIETGEAHDSVAAQVYALAKSLGFATKVFYYYQDKGFRLPGKTSCDPSRMPPPDLNTGPDLGKALSYLLQTSGSSGLPRDIISVDTCDSQSELALNSTALANALGALYSQTGSPIEIMANSMGAAIARGWLVLEETGQRPRDGVDTIVTIEGAHEGSWLARLFAGGNIRQAI
jgi:hypothetical protein